MSCAPSRRTTRTPRRRDATCPARPHHSYEEITRLAGTGLAQNSLNYINTAYMTLTCKTFQTFEGNSNYVNIISDILSQPSLSEPSKPIIQTTPHCAALRCDAPGRVQIASRQTALVHNIRGTSSKYNIQGSY